jgi:hypothetical protein
LGSKTPPPEVGNGTNFRSAVRNCRQPGRRSHSMRRACAVVKSPKKYVVVARFPPVRRAPARAPIFEPFTDGGHPGGAVLARLRHDVGAAAAGDDLNMAPRGRLPVVVPAGLGCGSGDVPTLPAGKRTWVRPELDRCKGSRTTSPVSRSARIGSPADVTDRAGKLWAPGPAHARSALRPWDDVDPRLSRAVGGGLDRPDEASPSLSSVTDIL